MSKTTQNDPTTAGTGRKAPRNEEESKRKVVDILTGLPAQPVHPSDHQFNNASHPRLPIPSLAERCTHAEQHRRWINDKGCRQTEILDDYNRWTRHFETAKAFPIHLIKTKPGGDTSF